MNEIEVSVSFYRHKTFGIQAEDEQVDVIMSQDYAKMALMSYCKASRANIKGMSCKDLRYDNDIVTFVYSCQAIEVLEMVPTTQFMQGTTQVQPYQYSTFQSYSQQQGYVQNQTTTQVQTMPKPQVSLIVPKQVAQQGNVNPTIAKSNSGVKETEKIVEAKKESASMLEQKNITTSDVKTSEAKQQ